MYKNAKPLFLITETPMHVGSGSDLGIVDLPIQRERHTNFPKIEASSLKGALREAFESAFKFEATHDNRLKVHRAFGYDKDGVLTKDKDKVKDFFGEDTQFSGALSLTDARLLLFPVKSLYGVFAWVTCPRVIKKFISDLALADIKPEFANVDFNDKENINKTTSKAEIINGRKVYLEEFVFTDITQDTANGNVDKVAKWLKDNLFGATDTSYWATKMEKDIIILDDKDFRDFVTLTTEVITRTKINNATGTVQDRALFSEEYLPAESVMYSVAMFADEFRANSDKLDANGVKDFFGKGLTANKNIVQIGGNATLGKGIVRTKFISKLTNGKEEK
ncbi:MAG: type III-B CRISPR module RAMP protein Cmr4 [Bernardetiaceae bacterium]|nr:type III-B CRISPR module RAMP protein Cmr4 [Bernardetiaceae bacterium]